MLAVIHRYGQLKRKYIYNYILGLVVSLCFRYLGSKTIISATDKQNIPGFRGLMHDIV